MVSTKTHIAYKAHVWDLYLLLSKHIHGHMRAEAMVPLAEEAIRDQDVAGNMLARDREIFLRTRVLRQSEPAVDFTHICQYCCCCICLSTEIMTRKSRCS